MKQLYLVLLTLLCLSAFSQNNQWTWICGTAAPDHPAKSFPGWHNGASLDLAAQISQLETSETVSGIPFKKQKL